MAYMDCAHMLCLLAVLCVVELQCSDAASQTAGDPHQFRSALQLVCVFVCILRSAVAATLVLYNSVGFVTARTQWFARHQQGAFSYQDAHEQLSVSCCSQSCCSTIKISACPMCLHHAVSWIAVSPCTCSAQCVRAGRTYYEAAFS